MNILHLLPHRPLLNRLSNPDAVPQCRFGVCGLAYNRVLTGICVWVKLDLFITRPGTCGCCFSLANICKQSVHSGWLSRDLQTRQQHSVFIINYDQNNPMAACCTEASKSNMTTATKLQADTVLMAIQFTYSGWAFNSRMIQSSKARQGSGDCECIRCRCCRRVTCAVGCSSVLPDPGRPVCLKFEV